METCEISRFMANVDVTPDCWLWTGPINGPGYGTFQDGSEHGVGAHRFSASTFLVGDGHVLHSCRSRHCVKPTHLRYGTNAENMRDKFFDGTQNTQKLTVHQVREIRERFVRTSPRKSNRNELAVEYGIHPRHLQRIAEGRVLEYVR